jgi:hypothetical protein
MILLRIFVTLNQIELIQIEVDQKDEKDQIAGTGLSYNVSSAIPKDIW